MRKQQLENLKIGDKVQAYNKKEIAIVKFLPQEEGQKYILTVYGAERLASANTLIKNYKLVEEVTEEVATTVEPVEIELTMKEKEFLYHMIKNYFSNRLESGFEFTFAVVEQLSYPEKSARGVISSLIKKEMITVEDQEDEENSTVSFTDKGKVYTESNLEELANLKQLITKAVGIPETISDIEAEIEIMNNIQADDLSGIKVNPGKYEGLLTHIKEEGKLITASQMAEQLGITPQDLRRQLRKNQFEKPEGGWKWNTDSKEYKDIVSVLKGIQEKREMKRVKA